MDDQFAAVAIEAPGPDPTRPECVRVAVIAFSRDREIERFVTEPRMPATGDSARDEPAAANPDAISATIRRLTADRIVVGYAMDLISSALAPMGIALPSRSVDLEQLAVLLMPTLPDHSLEALATALGVETQDQPQPRALQAAVQMAGVARALLARIEAIDALTLERVAALAHDAGWSVASVFAAAARRRLPGPLFDAAAADANQTIELAFLVPRERPEPLRRTGSTAPIDEMAIAKALAPGGVLSRAIPSYELRPAQAAMARAVTRAFNEDRQLLVEAGTGTGKSIAYLLPAILHARERGETVVVSTNTLALQDQLFRKDIPDLQRALSTGDGTPPFEVAILKGRSNYLCLRRWFAAQRQPVTSQAAASLRAKIMLWIRETETGDRAELRLNTEEDAEFRRLSAEGEACATATCVFQQRNQCFLFRARRQAEHAHLVVVNHALLLSDSLEGGRVLPQYERLIVDEAHHLEDQATAQFGFSVEETSVLDLVDSIVRPERPAFGGLLQQVVTELARDTSDGQRLQRSTTALDRAHQALNRATAAKRYTDDLFVRLRGLVDLDGETAGGYDRTLHITAGTRRRSSWVDVEVAWEQVDRALLAIEDDLSWFIDALERLPVPEEEGTGQSAIADLEFELMAALRQSSDLRARLCEVIIDPRDEAVYWIERDAQRGTMTLHAAPLHVGAQLRDHLFGSLRTAVLTSATLTADGTFDYVRQRLSLEGGDELAVPSPFDYERSTLLYLADDVPEPNTPGYQACLHRTLIALGEALGGRILVLFTSHAALQAAYRAIRGPLGDVGVTVLAQRFDGSPQHLIDRLRHANGVVVLGASTFWEGVDVVGPALSALVVTKLPFSVPSDPVFAARSEDFEEPFSQFAVPQAVLRFKQGFGRLIRSSHDRGVCAILDRRVISKRYGASFIQSLPPCSVAVGSAADLPAAASAWLRQDEHGSRR